MLEQDCYTLPGALGGLGTGDLFPPNLSCTVAGGCLPFTQHERGAITVTIVLIITRGRYRPSYRRGGSFPVLQDLDSCWGPMFGTSRKSRACVWPPRPSQGHGQIPTDAIASTSYSFSIPPTHPPLCNVRRCNLAGDAWVECQMLFLLGIYEKLSDSPQWCHTHTCRERWGCHMPLFCTSVSSDNWQNCLRCHEPVLRSV